LAYPLLLQVDADVDDGFYPEVDKAFKVAAALKPRELVEYLDKCVCRRHSWRYRVWL
jgi:hypothetical protein